MNPDRAFVPLFNPDTHAQALAIIRETRRDSLTLAFFHSVDAAVHILAVEAEATFPGAVLSDGRVHRLWGVVVLSKLLQFPEFEALALKRMTQLVEEFLPRGIDFEPQLANHVHAVLNTLIRERFGMTPVPTAWGQLVMALQRAKVAIGRF